MHSSPTDSPDRSAAPPPPAPPSDGGWDVSPRGFAALLSVWVAGAGAWCWWVTYSQYRAHRVFIADVGLFDWAIGGVWHGYWLRNPLWWHGGGNYFADHFIPALFAIMPFYLVHDGAMTFLTALVVALVGAAVPLAMWGAEATGRRWLGLAFAAMYLSNHFVASIHLANHVESLVFLPLFIAMLGLHRGNRWLYAAGLVGTMCVKEDMAAYVFLLGTMLAAFKHRRSRVWGWWTMAGAAAWLVLALGVMAWCGSAERAATSDHPLHKFAAGHGIGDVVWFFASHPGELVARVFRRPLVALLASVGFLAVLDPKRLVPGLVAASLMMVTDNPASRDVSYYYSYGAIAFLVAAAVEGSRLWLNRGPWSRPVREYALGALLILLTLIQAPLPTRTDGMKRWPLAPYPRHDAVVALNDLIPRDAVVAAQYDLFVFVQRPRLARPLRLATIDECNWALMDFRGRPADLLDKGDELERLMKDVQGPGWETVFEADGLMLRRRLK